MGVIGTRTLCLGTGSEGATMYQTIVIDPPWPYERTHGNGVLRDYKPMDWTALTELGAHLARVAAPDCAILLWTTAPLLMAIADVVRAWPFRYITKVFCWVKTTRTGAICHGIGSYTASNTEDVWLLSNGTPRRKNAATSQIIATEGIIAPRYRHSAKPQAFYDRVEALFSAPRLDVFARRHRDGWTCIGDELDGLDIIDSLALCTGEILPVVMPVATQLSFNDKDYINGQ